MYTSAYTYFSSSSSDCYCNYSTYYHISTSNKRKYKTYYISLSNLFFKVRHVILRWNTTGLTLAGIVGVADKTNRTLNTPYDVVVDWSRTLYIADYSNHRIQKYSMDASVGSTIAGDANGSGGNALNRLKYPSRLVVDVNGDIYIVDRSNFRVQFWANGAVTGVRVAGTGRID